MRCPFCRTENRDERDICYNCEKDLSMLRLIVNKAKAHFNTALEYAERDRNEEAIAELHNALDLDHSHVNSHVVLGTLYAKLGQMDKAKACWLEALTIDPRFEKAHQYLGKLDLGRKSLPVVRRQRFSHRVDACRHDRPHVSPMESRDVGPQSRPFRGGVAVCTAARITSKRLPW